MNYEYTYFRLKISLYQIKTMKKEKQFQHGFGTISSRNDFLKKIYLSLVSNGFDRYISL